MDDPLSTLPEVSTTEDSALNDPEMERLEELLDVLDPIAKETNHAVKKQLADNLRLNFKDIQLLNKCLRPLSGQISPSLWKLIDGQKRKMQQTMDVTGMG